MDSEREQWRLTYDGAPGEAGTPVPAPSLKEFLGIASRRRWSLILPLLTIVVLAAAVAFLMPSVYRATATILIEEQEIPADFVTATVTSYAEQRLQQINQRIMSSTRLIEVIDQFGLYHKMRRQRTIEEVITQMRKDVRLRQISADVLDRRTGRPTTATIAFTLSYEGKETPMVVQRVANVLVSLFLEENLQVRERQTMETAQFLEDEMARVRRDLDRAQAVMATFKTLHLHSLPEMMHVNMQGLSLAERSIERLVEQLRSVREREGYLESQLANLSPFLENSDRQRLEQLQTELALLETRLSAFHPDVVKLTTDIDALEKKLGLNRGARADLEKEPDNPAYVTLSAQLAGIRSEIVSIGHQIEEQRTAVARYQMRIEHTPSVEQEYKAIVDEQVNLQAKFNDLSQKHLEAKVAQGLERGQKGERFTLIDPPRLPETPVRPNRWAIAVIGVVLGLGAGVGWAALREFTDQSAHTVEHLALASGFPVLGEIPMFETDKEARRKRHLRYGWAAAALLALLAAVAAFHYWVMDLNVFWAKVGRRLTF
jgi:polysaccharide chain length determinant protein (PEP-CTERM system associated)